MRGPRRPWRLGAAVVLTAAAVAPATFVALNTLGRRAAAPVATTSTAGPATAPASAAATTSAPPPAPVTTAATTKGTGPDPGIPLRGSAVRLIGSVVSHRNLAGLLVQVNQIDVCTAPDLVAYLSLTDAQGNSFTNVRPEDFIVSVDGQPVADFDVALVKTEELPLSTVLTIDRSGSMRGEPIAATRTSAIDYVGRLEPEDHVGLVQFDTEVQTLSDPTADHQRVKDLISSIDVNSDTALHDAVAHSADLAPECGRRAVILMTDGRDTASKVHSLDEAIAKANVASTPVFVVGLRSDQFTPDVLRRISEETGAQYFEAPTPADIGELYQKVDQQLAGQLVVRFRLDLPRTGQERRLQVNTKVAGSPTVSERSFVW